MRLLNSEVERTLLTNGLNLKWVQHNESFLFRIDCFTTEYPTQEECSSFIFYTSSRRTIMLILVRMQEKCYNWQRWTNKLWSGCVMFVHSWVSLPFVALSWSIESFQIRESVLSFSITWPFRQQVIVLEQRCRYDGQSTKNAVKWIKIQCHHTKKKNTCFLCSRTFSSTHLPAVVN